MQKTIIIVTRNKYPQGDAGAIRQHVTAKILIKLGYKVLVIGNGEHTNFQVNEYDGVEYISLRCDSNNKLKRLKDHLLFGKRVIHEIELRSEDVFGIIVVDVLPDAFFKIEKFARKHKLRLIHDSVEWYSPEEFKLGRFSPDYILKEYTNRVAIGKRWSVIAISRYLQNYFKNKGCNVVRVPVIMDVNSINYLHKKESSKITIVYAGGPGRKDYLSEILEGVNLLSDTEREKIVFHIIGVDKEQLIHTCGVSSETIKKLENVVHAHGRIPHSDAIEWVKKADFTILIRNESLRYAKAGFPTKVVESLSCGTPVICNLSSDLCEFLDSDNAVIVDGHTPEMIAGAISKLLKYDDNALSLMRISARKTAVEFFDYRNYIDSFAGILK